MTNLPRSETFAWFWILLIEIAKSNRPVAAKVISGKSLTRERYTKKEDGDDMSLSTPKPQMTASGSMNQTLQLPEPERQLNPSAVIDNDWVPATQVSKMHIAETIRRVGPLRFQWYLEKAKTLYSKFVFSSRSTA